MQIYSIMENNSIEILRDFETRISELKQRIEALEAEIAAFRQKEEEAASAPVEEAEVDVDFNIDVIDIPAPAPEIPVPESDLPEDDLPSPDTDLPTTEDLPVEEDLPAVETPVEESPAPEIPAKAEKKLRTVDGSYAWQSALPGMPVKNIRSAISLFDRALFINTLFKEDYALYDRTIGDLNALSSTDEAIDYILEHFPDWNLGSDVVYSFIMALRKKLG